MMLEQSRRYAGRVDLDTYCKARLFRIPSHPVSAFFESDIVEIVQI